MRVAVAQTAPVLGANGRNLDQVVERLGRRPTRGRAWSCSPNARCPATCVDDLDELERLAEPVPGPSIRRLAEACAGRQVHAVMGLLETGADAIYNSAVLVGPEGSIGHYRKAHLPGARPRSPRGHGDTPFAVYETPVGRIGMAICYDIRFPEPTRLLALQGADIVAFPSNWPSSSGWRRPRRSPRC